MRSKECVWCQRKTRFLALASLAVLFGPPANAREKKTLQRTATDVQTKAGDTCIEQDLPTAINGNATFLCVQSQSGNVNRRSLVLFDFSSLPNVGVKSAVLTLQVTSAPASSRTYDAHRVTSLFLESTTSWNKRVDSLSWSASGGDFIGSRTSSAVINSSSASAAWDITSDVQAWFNGTPNYGTLIKDDAENGSGVFTAFASKEDSLEAHRPSLDVYFVQNVQNLAASGGNNSISLSWFFPSTIGSVIEPNVGVLILRRANQVQRPSFSTIRQVRLPSRTILLIVAARLQMARPGSIRCSCVIAQTTIRRMEQAEEDSLLKLLPHRVVAHQHNRHGWSPRNRQRSQRQHWVPHRQ
jgi:hypothetical protein